MPLKVLFGRLLLPPVNLPSGIWGRYLNGRRIVSLVRKLFLSVIGPIGMWFAGCTGSFDIMIVV